MKSPEGEIKVKNILKVNWIWNKHWSAEDKNAPGIMLFRREYDLSDEIKSCVVNISADTRYKLYVNGEFAEFGPARGDDQVWFYDTVDITRHMKKGKNCIGVAVLRYPEARQAGNHGMFRTSVPGLCISGEAKLEDGSNIVIETDETWKCKKDIRVSFMVEEERFAPLIIHEKVYGDPSYRAWKMPGYNDYYWENAFCYPKSQVSEAVSPGNLNPRPIPFLYRKQRNFEKISCIRMSVYSADDWEAFLRGEKDLVIPPNTTELIEIDAGEEMTGFIHAAFEGGLGAKTKFMYAEAYVQNGFEGPEQIPVKRDRTDKRNGHLQGYWDTYYLYGQGNEERAENYLPYWFRTFRFLQLRIETANDPVTLKSLEYEETGYPLEVKSHAATSDPDMEKIWEISERTLRRCMHETYEDCPYYEQLQYIMDTRSQILYTYAVSGDDRLARSCIEAMKRGQRYDGLMNCSYPNCNTNVIPGFSIFYISMVYDHMMYFGDRDIVREAMPAIENILNFFHRNLTPEGYVGKTGDVNGSRFWAFIDWAKEWNDTNGMPTAGLKGPLTMESFLYIYGLQKAADLADYLGRHEDAERFLREASCVQKALLKYCIGEKGMFTDGPGVEEYSQHCQVFAVLTGTGDPEKLKENLKETIRNDEFVQCTVAMCIYLFRALEKTEMYEYTDCYWYIWRKMLECHCTTCVESEAYARSECHGWGALILYELPGTVLGVRPAEPGYKKIRIRPVPGYLSHAFGSVYTPAGMIDVAWKKDENGLHLEYTAPEGWIPESISEDGTDIVLIKNSQQ